MQAWTGAHRAFAVKVFYKSGGSFVITQREFRREFGIHRDRAVLSAHAIKTWVRNFEAIGSTLNKKGGNLKTVGVDMLQRAMGDVCKRLTECLERNGGHLNDVIFGK
jgi:hypothetical protein